MDKILGLILELNPFHNGHLHFIKEAQKRVKPKLTIAVISSSFTMRGDISVIDKFTKTKLALEAGIDLVFELPFLSTVNSADYFAYNALSILTNLGITNLAFGVELDDINRLNQMKDIINSSSFQTMIQRELKKGFSYANSAYRVLKELSGDEVIIDNFTLPNNTLAIQYLRALSVLKPNVEVTTIKRIVNNYYDQEATGSISSATAIRTLLTKKEDIKAYIPNFETPSTLLNPHEAEEKMHLLLKYQALLKTPEDLRNVHGIHEGLENRFIQFANISSSYQDLLKNMQTKRYPPNKIKRLFLHILLETNKRYENQYIMHLRLMGANEKGLDYLNTLPKELKKSIITSFKNLEDNDIVQSEIKATLLYSLLANYDIQKEEYKIPIILGGKNDNKRNS